MSKTTNVPTSQSIQPSEDNYYGLLEPDCSWGLNQFGDECRVILTGDAQFLKKNITLFASFVNSRSSQRISPTIASVTVTENNMMRALRLFLYGQIFKVKAKIELIRDEENEIINSKVLNDSQMEREADRLSKKFRETQLLPAYSCLLDADGAKSQSSAMYTIGSIAAENVTDYS